MRIRKSRFGKMVVMKLIDISNLPPYFTSDSEGRGIFKHESDTHCTESELKELLADAEYYADVAGPDECPPGLKPSAKAVVRHCRRLLA
jgi:hypothetical protein